MAGRTFLMDGLVMSCTDEGSSDGKNHNTEDYDEEDYDDDEEEDDVEIEYKHCDFQEDNHQGDDSAEMEQMIDEDAPSMSAGFYNEIDNFLNKPPPLLKDKQGSKKKKSTIGDQGKKRGGVGKGLPDVPKFAAQAKVSTHRSGPGAKKSGNRVLDERLLQQAFEYVNKVQQEAIIEEVHEESMRMQALKSNSAPILRKALNPDIKSTEGNRTNYQKPKSANAEYMNDNSSRSRPKATGNSKKNPAKGIVRRLRSKTQTANGDQKLYRGFDTSVDVESASSARNVIDFEALVANFEQGTHLQQLREELEQSKASMAESRRAMQKISKEMSGKLRV